VSRWPAAKASRVFQALLRIGWTPKPGAKGGGSHVRLIHPNYPYTYTWAFHDSVEIGPKMLARIAKHTGLKPEDL
jgi:predicted RNA binding protein YcfA (HicA-like mRNA interferase family)